MNTKEIIEQQRLCEKIIDLKQDIRHIAASVQKDSSRGIEDALCGTQDVKTMQDDMWRALHAVIVKLENAELMGEERFVKTIAEAAAVLTCNICDVKDFCRFAFITHNITGDCLIEK